MIQNSEFLFQVQSLTEQKEGQNEWQVLDSSLATLVTPLPLELGLAKFAVV